jgi:hypothetical protein
MSHIHLGSGLGVVSPRMPLQLESIQCFLCWVSSEYVMSAIFVGSTPYSAMFDIQLHPGLRQITTLTTVRAISLFLSRGLCTHRTVPPRPVVSEGVSLVVVPFCVWHFPVCRTLVP